MDGFDEVKLEYQTIVFQKLQDMRTEYQNNHFFVASRTIETMRSGWQTSTILNVEPFSKSQSIQMIDKISDFDEEILNRFKMQLNNDTFYSKYKEFVSNPLLLSIMLMTYNQFAEIPEKLHLFYDKAFSTLYSEHDATKGGFVREKRMGKKSITSDEFEKIVSSFSMASYIDKKNTFENKRELLKYINYSKQFGDLIGTVDFNSEDLLYDLVDAICLLVKDGDEYKFIHRSFQEYFVSNFIEQLADERQQYLLINLFDRDPEIFYSDEFFSMLYDKNAIRINHNFFAVLLECFFKKFKSKTEIENIFSCFSNMYPEYFDAVCENIERIAYFSITLTAKNKRGNSGDTIKKVLNRKKYVIENDVSLKLIAENYRKKNDLKIEETTEDDFIELCLLLIKNNISAYSVINYNQGNLDSNKKLREAIKDQESFNILRDAFIETGNAYR